mmetsp:Transcript_17225/g.55162  ORF Transcript_17225/g.55162 Transcript_17225/m.55162 type:complete len:240 (+) Transcript_17225:172-891(+)
MSVKKPIGDPLLLTKKVHTSTKYANVKSTIDSGFNTIKLQSKGLEDKANTRFRKSENFRRFKSSAFVRLFAEEQVDFLLLDLREREEYEKNHIHGAMSYPAPLLTRAVNPFSAEILQYSNKEPERIIVIYDGADTTAVHTGNLFFEKGVDNVFVLTGGLAELAGMYPELIDGQLPPPPPTPSMSQISNASYRSRATMPPGHDPGRPLSKPHPGRPRPETGASWMSGAASSIGSKPSAWK